MVGEKNMASSSGWAVRSSADRVVSGSEKEEKSGGGGGVRRRARRRVRDKERRTQVLRNEDGMIQPDEKSIWPCMDPNNYFEELSFEPQICIHFHSGDCICRSLTFEHLPTFQLQSRAVKDYEYMRASSRIEPGSLSSKFWRK